MPTVFHLFIYILSTFSYLLPICYFLPFKLKVTQKMVFFCLLFINILLIGYLLGNIGVILLIISSCLYIALINDNYLLNTCVFIVTYLFCVVVENTFSLLWDTFIFPASHLQNTNAYYLLYILSYLLLLAVICPLIAKFLHPFIHKIQVNISKRLLLLIIVNLIICLIIFLFNIVIGEHIGYSRTVIAFNCILFGCYFFISTTLIVNLIKSHMDKMEMAMRQDAYDQLQDYTNQIENMYSSLRSFKHDYHNIMLTLSGYIEAEDISGLKRYFDKEIIPLNKRLSTNTANLNQLINIKDTEIKSLISAKLLYALELNIAINIEVTEEVSNIPMDTVDLARVLGIFLDNAIEASLETKKPAIQFAIINLESEYIFIVCNSFLDSGIPYAAFKKPAISTKGSNRGIGLYNAHEILSKYTYILWDTEVADSQFIQRLRILKNV
ncbi:MAG: GHKL domain-containing protein [Clostridium sp.]|nr:GHKL domain-containing protein [Clostridium sp.]